MQKKKKGLTDSMVIQLFIYWFYLFIYCFELSDADWSFGFYKETFENQCFAALSGCKTQISFTCYHNQLNRNVNVCQKSA